MPTVCIQCALEAFVAADGAIPTQGDNTGIFETSPEEHLRSHHAVLMLTEDRQKLEAKAAEIMRRKGLGLIP